VPVTTTSAPWLASAIAVARPMPRSRPAPVTIATFPSRYPIRTLLVVAAGGYVTGFARRLLAGCDGARVPGLDDGGLRSHALAIGEGLNYGGTS
jgi:hypothetical protein